MEDPQDNDTASLGPPVTTDINREPMHIVADVLSAEDGRDILGKSSFSSGKAIDERRMSSGQPISRQTPAPYFIVFSVSGIERSNVKNPIIRFDAKVMFLPPKIIMTAT